MYLRRHGSWQGEGTVVDRRGAVATVLLPDLALDVTLPVPHEIGDTLTLGVVEVDLPNLATRWTPKQV